MSFRRTGAYVAQMLAVLVLSVALAGLVATQRRARASPQKPAAVERVEAESPPQVERAGVLTRHPAEVARSGSQLQPAGTEAQISGGGPALAQSRADPSGG